MNFERVKNLKSQFRPKIFENTILYNSTKLCNKRHTPFIKPQQNMNFCDDNLKVFEIKLYTLRTADECRSHNTHPRGKRQY